MEFFKNFNFLQRFTVKNVSPINHRCLLYLLNKNAKKKTNTSKRVKVFITMY